MTIDERQEATCLSDSKDLSVATMSKVNEVPVGLDCAPNQPVGA